MLPISHSTTAPSLSPATDFMNVTPADNIEFEITPAKMIFSAPPRDIKPVRSNANIAPANAIGVIMNDPAIIPSEAPNAAPEAIPSV